MKQLVAHLSDDEIHRLRRGGHDYKKVYAAYSAAVIPNGAPTVILAKTVKGWTLGEGFEARNMTHQMKKMSGDELKRFRDRLELPITDKQLEDPPYYHPGPKSPEVEYMMERRTALGGCLPKRVVRSKPFVEPDAKAFAEFDQGTPEHQQVSTTMAFSRLLRVLLADKQMGERIVPIIPDEARTFGLDPLFRQIGIYSPHGQRYDPVDSKLLLSYTEKKDGQLLEEGITEAGSMASFTAAGTAYATHGEPMIPFYIFYSMFGFQRTGDLIWAFGDCRGRGFLMGATAGRTTLTGEGLQHDDGHSHVLASTVPNCQPYDPAFAFELATIVRHGMKRMYEREEDVFYYITLYNENYRMPPRPEGVTDQQIIKGIYRFQAAPDVKGPRVHLLGSGPLMLHTLRAQKILAEEFDVAADVWSVTSYLQLRKQALAVERWNRFHPTEPPKKPYITEVLEKEEGPIVATSDWMKSVPGFIARWVPQPFINLGTDGFGHSDTREALRRYFEIDAESIVVAALSLLSRGCKFPPARVAEVIKKYGIDPEKPEPRLV